MAKVVVTEGGQRWWVSVGLHHDRERRYGHRHYHGPAGELDSIFKDLGHELSHALKGAGGGWLREGVGRADQASSPSVHDASGAARSGERVGLEAGAGMGGGVDVGQLTDRGPGIDQGRGQALVAQQFLDESDVGPGSSVKVTAVWRNRWQETIADGRHHKAP